MCFASLFDNWLANYQHIIAFLEAIGTISAVIAAVYLGVRKPKRRLSANLFGLNKSIRPILRLDIVNIQSVPIYYNPTLNFLKHSNGFEQIQSAGQKDNILLASGQKTSINFDVNDIGQFIIKLNGHPIVGGYIQLDTGEKFPIVIDETVTVAINRFCSSE